MEHVVNSFQQTVCSALNAVHGKTIRLLEDSLQHRRKTSRHSLLNNVPLTPFRDKHNACNKRTT